MLSTITIPIDQELSSLGANFDLGAIVSNGVQAAIIIAGLAVFGMLIWGGYDWLMSGGDKTRVEAARNRITNALVGLAIIGASYAIFTLIDSFFGTGLTRQDPVIGQPCSLYSCPSGYTCVNGGCQRL